MSIEFKDDELKFQVDALSDKLDAMTAERNKLLARVVELEKERGEMSDALRNDLTLSLKLRGQVVAAQMLEVAAQERAFGLTQLLDADRLAMAEKSAHLEKLVAEATTREAEAIATLDTMRAEALAVMDHALFNVNGITGGDERRLRAFIAKHAALSPPKPAMAEPELTDAECEAYGLPYPNRATPCAHSHTVDLKCIDCGAAVPETEPLAKAVEYYVLPDNALECPHCERAAILSDRQDGLFSDGDGTECMSCGIPGHVWADGDAEWQLRGKEGDRCNDPKCPECPKPDAAPPFTPGETP